MNQIPEAGFLCLAQIIGQSAVTAEEAVANRGRGKGPKRPRPAIPALIPVSKSTWWAGIQQNRFPKPVKLGRSSVWRVENIMALIKEVAK